MTIGEKVWDRLRAEGGFVHTMSDGRQFVRFNRGHHPSDELVGILKKYRAELKAFIIQKHIDDERRWAKAGTPRALGSSQTFNLSSGSDELVASASATRYGRSAISQKSGKNGVLPGPVAKTAAISAVIALLAGVTGPGAEIGPAIVAKSGGSVGLVDVRFTMIFPGARARVCLPTLG